MEAGAGAGRYSREGWYSRGASGSAVRVLQGWGRGKLGPPHTSMSVEAEEGAGSRGVGKKGALVDGVVGGTRRAPVGREMAGGRACHV
jgi:hypothetical protein